MNARTRHAPVAVVAVLLAACAHAGPFVWVDDLPPPVETPEAGYLIGSGDLLALRVFNQDAMSARVRVRSDGRVTLPFLGDVEAAGYAPGVLALQIETRLKEFVVKPVVTLTVEEPRPALVSVVGEVAKPGAYPLAPGSGVLHALAASGGLTDFAARDRIFVLRTHSPTVRIRFDYRALSRAQGRASTFQLEGGDVVVVE